MVQIYMLGREQGSGFRDAVNPFLLRIPALRESPARTSLSGRSPGCESPGRVRLQATPLLPALVLSCIGVKKVSWLFGRSP